MKRHRLLPARAGLVLRLAAIAALVLVAVCPAPARAQGGPLEITVAGAEFKPLPLALLAVAPADPALAARAGEIDAVLRADLDRSGLFELIPREAFLKADIPFDVVPAYEDWRVINAEALAIARLDRTPDGRLALQFRVFDVVAGTQMVGQQLTGPEDAWRRLAHKLADGVYAALTGEGAYFDSRIAFIDETGPKDARVKRLAIMDQDGANLNYPGPRGLVLTPRFSPDGERVLYISYDTGQPEIFLLDLASGRRERLGNFPGMSFAPRFAPSGETVVLSLAEGGNTDLYTMRLASRRLTRLTRHPGIDTSASFSPDGRNLVFKSDRGGSQQLYIMPAAGGPAERISFGRGRYGTPVWSPKGDLIAFTKIVSGRFHIGVMRTDGSGERLLTTSFLDEGPSFAPNGRVLVFYRDAPGERGAAQLISVDVTGRSLREVPTPNAASDPSWSPLRR